MSGVAMVEQVEAVSPGVSLVSSVYDAFGRKDIPAIFALLDHSCTITQSTRLPWGGAYAGHDGVLEFFGRLTSAIESTVETERYIDDQDGHVVAIGVTRGRVVATGRPFEIAETHVWTVRDGKVLRFESYIDTARMREVLGLPE
jgi:hypothetical protein